MIQSGNCGALADDLVAGDLFSASLAYCGEGAAQYYQPDVATVAASVDPREWLPRQRLNEATIHRGQIYTTSALFAESAEDIEAWFHAGYSAVDMETASTFAVAKHFGMDRTSIVYVFDHPRQGQHILLDDAEKTERRRKGNSQAASVPDR